MQSLIGRNSVNEAKPQKLQQLVSFAAVVYSINGSFRLGNEQGAES